MSVLALPDLKLRLNKSLTVDDVELQSMLDAAEAEYAAWVGPLPGSVTQTFDGGGTLLVLRSPNVTAITAASYASGAALSTSDLVLDTYSGIVRWGYGTAGVFTSGTRVSITYTVGSLPADHAEAILADVAGYFATTQTGPAGPIEDGYESAAQSSPVVLFPRIRALAATYPRVG